MNRISPAWSDVSMPTRSPGRSSTGPEVVRMFTPSSFAISRARVVLPSPGGPKKRAWSSGSRRCFAASIAIWSDSLTFAWPTNSSSLEGRSAASAERSSGSASGVVIWARGISLSPPPRRPRPPADGPFVGLEFVPRVAVEALVHGPGRAVRNEPPVRRAAPGAVPLGRARHRHVWVRSCSARRTSASASPAPPPSPARPRKEPAPKPLRKPDQRPPVPPHNQLGREGHRPAHRRQPLHHAQRHDDLVAEPARRLHQHAVGVLRRDATAHLGDHAV